jgi:hypothetical protein
VAEPRRVPVEPTGGAGSRTREHERLAGEQPPAEGAGQLDDVAGGGRRGALARDGELEGEVADRGRAHGRRAHLLAWSGVKWLSRPRPDRTRASAAIRRRKVAGRPAAHARARVTGRGTVGSAF